MARGRNRRIRPSFHHLFPSIAAITNLEPDHLDIYGTEAAFRVAFEQFGSQVQDTCFFLTGLDWTTMGGNRSPAIERFAVINAGEDPGASANHVARSDVVDFHVGMNATSKRAR